MTQLATERPAKGQDGKYAVLMPVYIGENPACFRDSIQSVLDQTLPPDEFVLVCDGPLNEGLEAVIDRLGSQLGPRLNLVRLAQGVGLSGALNAGLDCCSCEWVLRMDSDDLAEPHRAERQLAYATEHGLDVVSAWAAEFSGSPENITAVRQVPETHDQISRSARRRNPINHPCVLYRRQAVLAAGGYRELPRFEDYDLWARLLLAGARFGNLQQVLLRMRAGDDLYRRRGGWRYCRDITRFWTAMRRIGFIGWPAAAGHIVARCLISLLPNSWRRSLYRHSLRKTVVKEERSL